MGTYYNEIDPFAAAWLRNLIAAGHLPAGDVDDRSIADVEPTDLAGYGACHFFCGIAGWPLALRLAGVPDDEPVWTGSCPCQPFSVAGKGAGTDDKRHLWPEFHRLIAECRPASVLGEQVASADGRLWLAGVRADLEALGYAVGAADLCAAGIGAPHIRQRLYWVAQPGREPSGWGLQRPGEGAGEDGGWTSGEPERPGGAGGLAHAEHSGLEGRGRERGLREGSGAEQALWGGAHLGLADTLSERGRGGDAEREHTDDVVTPGTDYWAASRLIRCGDGKVRRIPVEPELFPLAPSVSGRVGILGTARQGGTAPEETRWVSRVGVLKGAGNAITVPLAVEFVRAAL